MDMMSAREDFSNLLIADRAIHQKLPSIFTDSMVLDYSYNIRVISQNVLDFLEFSMDELRYKYINYITGAVDLGAMLKSVKEEGSVDETQVSLYTKSSRAIPVSVSGFCLNQISGIDGYIILQINNLTQAELIHEQFQQKRADIDHFIYRTAHDLRGPLATIKGLINLLKVRENIQELDRLLPMIDAHANKLDERLFNLVYLAQADVDANSPKNEVDYNAIETTLRKIIEHNAFVDFLEFHYTAPLTNTSGVNEILLTSMLKNLLLYILSLPMKSLESKLFFRFMVAGPSLNITIGIQGFNMSRELAEVVRDDKFIYMNMASDPQFLNFYAVQKIAWKLKAKIRIHFVCNENQRVNLQIPLVKDASLRPKKLKSAIT